MTADLETLVVAAYYFASLLPVPRAGRPPRVSDAELVALAVGQAVMGICSDRQFLGLVGKVLPGLFPRLLSQSPHCSLPLSGTDLAAELRMRIAG